MEKDIRSWVEMAENKDELEFREAVHTTLTAIAQDPNLQANMILKGGILLAIRYASNRYTKDIDLSTDKRLAEITPEKIKTDLDNSLAIASATLEYDLDCKVHSAKVTPSNRPENNYHSIKIVVGYAYKGSKKHQKLIALQSPTTISIDYSLNELIPNTELIAISDNEEILAYALTDLIAEKLRSLLQQKHRKRNRRQDIYDLNLILTECKQQTEPEKKKILESLIVKARSRDIEPSLNSLDDPDLKAMAHAEYHTLEDDVEGSLPDFNESFARVLAFYQSLPWQT